MKALDRFIEYMTEGDDLNNEHLQKFGLMWAVLFVILGVMLFIVAYLFATIASNSPEFQIVLTFIFALAGMLLILMGKRLYENHTTERSKP